ncbi:MAG: hypothetical protein NT166_27185 [Candidatus Aminicenantes bacterium]|nr:hypothetical protein [Candidatus Aminicenantes bacterium]
MSQTYTLDTIIKEIPTSTRAVPDPSSKKIMLNTNSGQIVDHRTIFSTIKVFLVFNIDDDKQNFAEGDGPIIYVGDFKNDRSINLTTSYRVSCPKGNEEKLVKALASDIHPTAALENKIKKWANEYLHDNETRFINEFKTRKNELEISVERKAMEEAGLSLDLKVAIKLETIERISFTSKFDVFSCDYDEEEQYLKTKIEIEVDENNIINALLAKVDPGVLENDIKNELKKYFCREVSLHQIFFDLKDTTLKNRVISHLDEYLQKIGRKVTRISIEHDYDMSKLQAFYQTADDVEIQCSIQEYPEPVVIKNKLQLELEDIVKYRKSDVQELKIWIERNLEEIVHKYLFDIKYIDLLLNFNPIEEDIRKELKSRALDIGYHLKLLIAAHNLKQRELTRPFTIDNVDRVEFATKSTRYKVKVGISVRARIRDLTDIEELLNRQADVLKEMKDSIIDETAQYLHSIDLKHFYTNFDYSDEGQSESVSQKLKALITQRLEKELKAEIISINLQSIDTAITGRYHAMMGQLCNLRIEIDPLSGDEKIIFIGKFKVVSVDVSHWDDFLACIYNLDEITKLIEEHLINELKYTKMDELRYYRYQDSGRFKNIINRMAGEYSAAQFGLNIEIVSFSREKTEKEKLQVITETERLRLKGGEKTDILKDTANLKRKLFQTKSEEMDKLLAKRNSLVGLENSQKEIEEIDLYIEKVKDELESFLTQNYNDQGENIVAIPDGTTLAELENRILQEGQTKNDEHEKKKILAQNAELINDNQDKNNGKEEEEAICEAIVS